MKMGQTLNEVFIEKTDNKLTTITVIKATYLAIRKTDHIQENMIKKKIQLRLGPTIEKLKKIYKKSSNLFQEMINGRPNKIQMHYKKS